LRQLKAQEMSNNEPQPQSGVWLVSAMRRHNSTLTGHIIPSSHSTTAAQEDLPIFIHLAKSIRFIKVLEAKIKATEWNELDVPF